MLGWNTEHLSNLNKNANIELIRINNQWKIVQAYYSIYCISEAAAYLLNGTEAGGHSKCLNKIGEYLATRKNHFPWNLAVHGSFGKAGDAYEFRNFPTSLEMPKNNLTRSGRPIAMIALCLKAEHGKRVKEYSKPKGKGLLKYNYNPGNTTILSFLYRLRILSNYKDVEIFLTQSNDQLIKRFSDDLSFICFYTNSLFEIFSIRKIGIKKFKEHVASYRVVNPSASELVERFSYYEKWL